jgi:hypothetical protein
MAKKLSINLSDDQISQIQKFIGKKIKGTIVIGKREDVKITKRTDLNNAIAQFIGGVGAQMCW